MNLPIPRLGLGTLPLAGGYGPIGADEAVTLIRHALDVGVRLIDTADFYGGGDVERLVGRAVAGRRDDAVIATRGGAVIEGSARPSRFDGTPAFLRRACDASLRRLGVDHIDLYYLAREDPATPIEESIGALAELVAAGKVRHIGLSEVPAATLRRAHRVHPVTALQSEYSLWEQRVRTEIRPTATELGVGFWAHSPLGRGFLAGALDASTPLAPGDYRARQPRFAPDALARDRARLETARRYADAHGATLAQVALAWLLAQPGVGAIPGTRDAAHLAGNAAAASIALAPDEIDALGAAFAPAGDPADAPDREGVR